MSESAGKQRGPSELLIYYLLIALYFFAFGLQFVLYPSLVTFVLEASPQSVGMAQTALSAPMFLLLLAGGLIAERTRAGITLAVLQTGIAAASVGLAAIVLAGQLTYMALLLYGVLVGSFAALLGPARDSALNGVVERAGRAGRTPSIAMAAAMTTSVQIGAQIAGIIVARAAGGHPAPFLALQALVLTAAAVVALFLRAPKPERARGDFGSAIRDVADGLAYAFRNPVMGPMMISAAYSGVFIIGALQVLFPLIIREAYGGSAFQQSNLLSVLFSLFWGASFVSAVALTRLPPLRRPGRAMLISHLIGGVLLLSFSIKLPFWALSLGAVAFGLAAGVWISMSRTIAQCAAEPRYLGRVLAVYAMGFMGGAPIGSALSGIAAAQFGALNAALFPAIGLLVGAGALAAFTSLWRMRQSEGYD